MRALASRTRPASRSSTLPPASGSPSWSTSTAIPEATSPACAPPIPSATAKSGERAWNASSLARRWRPVSVRSKCSATRSISPPSTVHVGELAVADPHAVAGVQRLRAAEELLVEVRAVRRAEVLEHDDPALLDQPRVARGGERVLEADLRLVAAAHHRAVADVVLRAGRGARRALHDQPRLQRGAARADRRGGVQPGRVVRGRGGPEVLRLAGRATRDAAAQVLQRAARDPQQEQVEHREEAELERDGDGFQHHSTSKVASTVPNTSRSPERSGSVPLTRRPLTWTPFVEPRSVTVH